MSQGYTAEDMGEALEAARSDFSLKEVAENHTIPRQNLQHRLQRKRSSMEQYQRISRDKENEICDWALTRAKQGEPPTYVQIVEHASRILSKSGDVKPLGKNWINGFVRRHPSINDIKSKKTAGRPKESFFASTDMDEENSKRASKALHSFILNTFVSNGLPQQLLGVRPPSGDETFIHDNNHSLTMACGETSGSGTRTLSTERLSALSQEFNMAAAPWIRFVEALAGSTKRIGVPQRLIRDPGHSKVEWSEFEDVTVTLTELALDLNRGPRPVFRKSLDIFGKVRLECKTNNEIIMERLGPIVGRNWFICPSASTLSIYSALFVYNQIKFQAIELDERDNMLPWIYIKTYVGPFPKDSWTRYISSHGGEAHMQFHVKYITSEPTSTTQPTQPGKDDHQDGFCILRQQYDAGTGGSGGLPSERRVSVAMKTTTAVSESYYSAMTLADSSAFQDGFSGEAWDEEFSPLNCGRFTGIAVFQAIVYRALRLCEAEHRKIAEAIVEQFTQLGEINKQNTKDFIAIVLAVVCRTTQDVGLLVGDCDATIENIVKHAEDNRATRDSSIIHERWQFLKDFQEGIETELKSIFRKLCDKPCL